MGRKERHGYHANNRRRSRHTHCASAELFSVGGRAVFACVSRPRACMSAHVFQCHRPCCLLLDSRTDRPGEESQMSVIISIRCFFPLMLFNFSILQELSLVCLFFFKFICPIAILLPLAPSRNSRNSLLPLSHTLSAGLCHVTWVQCDALVCWLISLQ